MENNNDYLAHHVFSSESDVLVSDLENSEFLEHYQIKGAKHGVRRFQNYDGSLTPEGRERYGVGEGRKEKKKDFKDLVNRAVENERKKVAEKKAREKVKKEEDLKDYLVKHPTKLAKHSHELKQKDVDEIIGRIQLDRKCKDIKRDEYYRILNKINTAKDTLNMATSLLGAGVNAYNNAALIYNGIQVLRGRSGVDISNVKPLPRIAWGDGGGQNQQNQNQNQQGKKNQKKGG